MRTATFLLISNCISLDAIEKTGYDWFLHNIVNNENGGWPFVIGAAKFENEKFDFANVSGNKNYLLLTFSLKFVSKYLSTIMINFDIYFRHADTEIWPTCAYKKSSSSRP